MLVKTSRFGTIDLNAEDLLDLPEGLLGFGHLHKFVFLDDPNDGIFAWLQSCEDPQIAFPVLEPELFTSSYRPMLSKSDLEALRMNQPASCRYFTIVTIPQDPTQMTANLKAPIVVNTKDRIGRQCVLQDNNLAIREPIFSKLQSRVIQSAPVVVKNPSDDFPLVHLKREVPSPEIEK